MDARDRAAEMTAFIARLEAMPCEVEPATFPGAYERWHEHGGMIWAYSDEAVRAALLESETP